MANPMLASSKSPSQLNTCWCGCGGATKGKFVPGHDAKFHSLAKKAARGQLEAGQTLESILANLPHDAARSEFIHHVEDEIPKWAIKQEAESADKARKAELKAQKDADAKAKQDAQASAKVVTPLTPLTPLPEGTKPVVKFQSSSSTVLGESSEVSSEEIASKLEAAKVLLEEDAPRVLTADELVERRASWAKIREEIATEEAQEAQETKEKLVQLAEVEVEQGEEAQATTPVGSAS